MINILGKWMTPILLSALMFLITIGIIDSPSELQQTKDTDQMIEIFSSGFLTGYQTMDLFAAFFFSSLIFAQIQKNSPDNISNKELISIALKPSLLGATLLALVYGGFVYLGAHYSELIQNVSPELMLPTITKYLLGEKAIKLIAIIIIFSCLTTAIALNNIYAQYLCSLFKIAPKYFPFLLIITTILSFLISLFDFKGIVNFLAPILEFTYPSLIILTSYNVISYIVGHKAKYAKILFYTSLTSMILYKINLNI